MTTVRLQVGNECVYACVCSFWDLGVSCSSIRTQPIMKTGKDYKICHMKQVLFWISSSFCVFIPSYSLRSQLDSSLGLGWFLVTITDWPTTRPKLLHKSIHTWCSSSSLYNSPRWQLCFLFPIFCLWASWPSSLNSSPLLWVSQFIIFHLIFTFHQSCTNEKAACTFQTSSVSSWFLEQIWFLDLVLHVVN